MNKEQRGVGERSPAWTSEGGWVAHMGQTQCLGAPLGQTRDGLVPHWAGQCGEWEQSG